MQPRRTRFYLDKTDGKIGGVCSGIADYFDVDVLLVRILAVATTMVGVPTPLLYILLWVLADPKPAGLYDGDDRETQKFWSTVRVSPQRSIRDVHSRFRDIDRRLRDIEAHAVSANTRLAAEIDSLR